MVLSKIRYNNICFINKIAAVNLSNTGLFEIKVNLTPAPHSLFYISKSTNIYQHNVIQLLKNFANSLFVIRKYQKIRKIDQNS